MKMQNCVTLQEILAAGEYTDWQQALSVALRDNRGQPSLLVGAKPVSTEDFTWADVKKILGSSDGENDCTSWIATLKLKDGRFAFLSAWCDYTGWGCQDGGSVRFAGTLSDLVKFAMDDDARARLLVKKIPGETNANQ